MSGIKIHRQDIFPRPEFARWEIKNHANSRDGEWKIRKPARGSFLSFAIAKTRRSSTILGLPSRMHFSTKVSTQLALCLCGGGAPGHFHIRAVMLLVDYMA
jgi:hypothetical protein